MPVVTRSKARLEQPSGLLASSGNGEGNHPRRIVESRQGNGVVIGRKQLGSPTPKYAAANGSQSSQGFGLFKCKDKRCLTCPKYINEHKCKSNTTQKVIT